jgi:hypothetical protein
VEEFAKCSITINFYLKKTNKQTNKTKQNPDAHLFSSSNSQIILFIHMLIEVGM